MPRRYRRRIIVAVGVLAGIILWLTYLRFMLPAAGWPTYVLFGLTGAACGYALVTIPRFIWHFLRKQVYQVLMRQWTDRSHVVASVARHELQEEDTPRTPQRENDLAVIAFLQRDFPAAVEGFSAARQHGAKEPQVNLSVALAETSQWDQLKSLLQTDQSAESLPALSNLARLAAFTPDTDLVERLWNVAQQHASSGARPEGLAALLNNLAVRAMQERRLPQAARALKLALQRQPSYPYAHANLAVLAWREDDLNRAISENASAAGLVAEEELVFSNFGAFLALAGDARAAEPWLLRAHRLQPRHPAILTNLANVYRLVGKTDEAIATYHAAISQPQEPSRAPAQNPRAWAHYNLAHLLHAQGHLGPALEHLQTAAAHVPDDPDILTNTGCVMFADRDFAAAYRHFAQAAELASLGRFRRNLIRSELASGHLAEAAELLEQEQTDGGAEADHLDVERGLVSLLRALQIKPETETHRQMIEFNLSAAAGAFTKAITKGGTSALEAALNYALTQYARGDYRAAAETLAQTLQKNPGHGRPDMYYATGMAFIMAGMREREQHDVAADGKLPGPVRELFLKARPYLEKALELGMHRGATEPTAAAVAAAVPQHALAEIAAYDLGLLNYLLGEYQKAIDVFRKIVRNESPPHLLNAMAISQARLAQEMQLSAQTATLMADSRKAEVRHQSRQLLAAAIYYFKLALQIAPQASLTHANMGLALMLRNQRGDVEDALQHWQLMHQHGDARARKTFEAFMQAQSPEAAQRLRFQDMELIFRPLNVADWVVIPLPRMSPPRYLIEELLDIPDWQLVAYHKLVNRALTLRRKAERTRSRLRRLAL
ncbi:MAG: tetratricopeptide repeat protein [Armatimonadia bacterium]